MAAKPKSVDEYLSGVAGNQRAALDHLRKAIRAAAPDVEEGFSYGVPAFLRNGKAIAGYAAAAHHLSYFPMSGRVVAGLANDLKRYDFSKGTIRFTPQKPLSASLVKKLVRARIAEIEAKAAKVAPTRTGKAQTDPDVESFLAKLDHPLKKEIETVRKILLSVSPKIHEGIKWNAPSFRTTDYFATFHLRATDRVQLVFHKGAKAKHGSTKAMRIADPAGRIEWLAPDRCMVTLGAGKDISVRRKAFEAIVRAWIRRL